MRKHERTDEEKVALKIAKIVDSASLDLDRVGIELARLKPSIYYNRLMLIAESAQEETERVNAKQYDRLF